MSGAVKFAPGVAIAADAIEMISWEFDEGQYAFVVQLRNGRTHKVWTNPGVTKDEFLQRFEVICSEWDCCLERSSKR